MHTEKTATFIASISSPKAGKDNAILKTLFINPGRIHIKKLGCSIYSDKGKLIKNLTESCSRDEFKFYVCYDLERDLGLMLKSNTDYLYRFFIVHEDIAYVTDICSFSTV